MAIIRLSLAIACIFALSSTETSTFLNDPKKGIKLFKMNNLRNSVQLIGRLGADPEVITLQSGAKVAKLNLATSDSYKNAKGEKIIETQWHRIECWNKTAELMEKLLKKGHEVLIHGKLIHESYQDKEGNTRYVSKVKAYEFIKLSKDMEAA